MELRELGRSGVKVSAVALGTMTFGGQTPREEAFVQLDLARDIGINLFDTAENYPSPVSSETQGRSEEILGEWVAARGIRDKVVIATKVTGPGGMDHIRGPERRLDRGNIEAAVEGSLRRLNTDYIDLYQIHWPDRSNTLAVRPRYRHIADPRETPVDETLGVLADLVAAGKVRHIGIANETSWGMMRYLNLHEQGRGPRIASVQNGYSLIDRRFELGAAEVALRENVGLLAYSPLAGGQLTGKHIRSAPADGRMSHPGMAERYRKPRLVSAVAEYVAIAERHGLSPAAMALAFVRERPFVTAVLMAASSLHQLQDNLESLQLTVPPEVVKEIEAVHDSNPNPIY